MLNKDLADRIIATIKAEPWRWDQSWFASNPMGAPASSAEADTCSSSFCIAGWAVALAAADRDMTYAEFLDGRDTEDVAAGLLRLDYEQAEALFFRSINITQDRDRYGRANTPKHLEYIESLFAEWAE